MLMPPAPAGVPENSSSPVEEFNEMLLLWMLTFRFSQYGNCAPVATPEVTQEPGVSVCGAALQCSSEQIRPGQG